MSNKRMILDGLVDENTAGPRLIAGRCRSCGTLSFPAKPDFHQPSCPSRDVEQVPLSRTGTLVSYTINYYQPPPPFRMEPFEPYAIGVAELKDGIQVIGMLTGTPLDELEVGRTVELVVERLYTHEDGTEVHTWKWKVLGST